MYSTGDIADLKSQKTRCILAWLVPEALLIGLVIFSFVRRIQWLTASLFALLGCVILFSLSFYVLPLARYQKHLERALFGRQRRSVLAFQSAEDKTVIREGVVFVPVRMTAGSPQEPMDDRQLYWDANLPLPAWQAGDRLVIHSHEKAITRWEPAGVNEALDG